MLRPHLIPCQQGSQSPDRLAGARPGTAEQRPRQQQEVPVSHGAHGAPFASFREGRRGGRRGGVGEYGDPLWITSDNRLERHLGGRRRDVAEDVASTGLGGQLIQVAAVADDDRRVIPNNKGKGGGGS